ncbi:hypothetical protein EXN22_16205 [Pseudomonas tructae]|uniref:Uncharacterized protein n=1 Tax=Pseudomonas tructae TaxID=2518644 RepID=A0A411MK64_9PSED|nr:hypothetical protein [Pseudomonas tructae]QBF27157.1 hypothetical protein EXN22_16205 [Pseudomonas tructae]
MSSVVEICNMALSNLGQSARIDDLSEASVPAEQCSLWFVHCRDYVLRADCDWPFATKFEQLAGVASNPDPEFPYAFAVPIDCMRIRRIVNPAFPQGYFPHCHGGYALPAIPPIRFRVINGSSQRLIATSVDEAKLEYTMKVESPEMFDPMFVDALSWYLASKIAPSLGKDTSIAGNCFAQYQAVTLQAAAAALNEGTPPPPHESAFIAVRN